MQVGYRQEDLGVLNEVTVSAQTALLQQTLMLFNQLTASMTNLTQETL
jgi:hypothetical protein